MLDRLIVAVGLVVTAILSVALVLTAAMVSEEIKTRDIRESTAEHLPAGFVTSAPSACQVAALQRATASVPDLDISWFWVGLSERKVVGLAYNSTHKVLLDPSLPCADVPAVALHEWTHIATSVYYEGNIAGLTGAVPAMAAHPEIGIAPGDPLPISEVIADCGSSILTARLGERFTHHPYWDLAGGCAPDMRARTLAVLTHVHAGRR